LLDDDARDALAAALDQLALDGHALRLDRRTGVAQQLLAGGKQPRQDVPRVRRAGLEAADVRQRVDDVNQAQPRRTQPREPNRLGERFVRCGTAVVGNEDSLVHVWCPVARDLAPGRGPAGWDANSVTVDSLEPVRTPIAARRIEPARYPRPDQEETFS